MGINKKLQKGSTLVEILISMMILSISISAFIALEVKIFGDINEAAKKQSIVNAIYNLSQNMSINPILNPTDGSKNFDYYNLTNCLNQKNNKEDNILSKKDFANKNLTDFCNSINNINGLSITDINILICNNEILDYIQQQKITQYNNSSKLSCNNNGSQTIIKTLWTIKTKRKKERKFYYSIAIN